MITDHDLAAIDKLVGQHFSIQNITYAAPKQPFIVRYQGALRMADSVVGFDQLSGALAALNLIGLLRREEGVINLYILPKLEPKKKLNPRINLILFILTLISVMVTGGLYAFQGDMPDSTWQLILQLARSGWPFALSLLAILSAHEFGHYFAGRRNQVQVSLPYFVPFPLSFFGTMGAFINMRSLPKNRRALFDLAVAGPLSGLVVTILVLLIGLNLSELSVLPSAPPASGGLQMEGNSLLYLLLKFAVFGRFLPEPASLSGAGLLLHWASYFFTGQPFPWGSVDVMLHPVAWAGWAGILVTGINLIPAGQLDGGHIFYALFGKHASERFFPFIVAGLGVMGFFWSGWWLWAALVFLLGRRHAEPLDQVTELDPKRRWLGYLALVIFILTFIPVPITLVV